MIQKVKYLDLTCSFFEEYTKFSQFWYNRHTVFLKWIEKCRSNHRIADTLNYVTIQVYDVRILVYK